MIICGCWWGRFVAFNTSTSCQTSALQSLPFLLLRTNLAANSFPVAFSLQRFTTAYCPLKSERLTPFVVNAEQTAWRINIYFTQQLNTLPCLPSDFVENIEVIFNRFCARGKGHCEWYSRLPAYHKSVSRRVSIRSHLALDPATIEIFGQPWPVTLNRSENASSTPRVLAAHLPNWPTNQNRRMLFGLRLPFIVTSAHSRSSRMITLWNAKLSSKSP